MNMINSHKNFTEKESTSQPAIRNWLFLAKHMLVTAFRFGRGHW